MDRKTPRQKPLEEITYEDIFSELVQELTSISKQPGEFTIAELVEKTGRKPRAVIRLLNNKVKSGILSKRKVRVDRVTSIFYKALPP